MSEGQGAYSRSPLGAVDNVATTNGHRVAPTSLNAHQQVDWHRSRPRYRVDKSGRRAAPPSSRVAGVTRETAPRPRVRPTELQAPDRRGPGSERSPAGKRHP